MDSLTGPVSTATGLIDTTLLIFPPGCFRETRLHHASFSPRSTLYRPVEFHIRIRFLLQAIRTPTFPPPRPKTETPKHKKTPRSETSYKTPALFVCLSSSSFGVERKVVLPSNLVGEFEKIAKANTDLPPYGIETCGILAGRLVSRSCCEIRRAFALQTED